MSSAADARSAAVRWSELLCGKPQMRLIPFELLEQGSKVVPYCLQYQLVPNGPGLQIILERHRLPVVVRVARLRKVVNTYQVPSRIEWRQFTSLELLADSRGGQLYGIWRDRSASQGSENS